MTICFCEKHGRQPCEKVSKYLDNELKNGHDISKRLREFAFVIEHFEWPFYGLQEEVEQIPEVCINGNFIVQSEERLNDVLERITILCLGCLKEAMNGAALPVKSSGQP